MKHFNLEQSSDNTYAAEDRLTMQYACILLYLDACIRSLRTSARAKKEK